MIEIAAFDDHQPITPQLVDWIASLTPFGNRYKLLEHVMGQYPENKWVTVELPGMDNVLTVKLNREMRARQYDHLLNPMQSLHLNVYLTFKTEEDAVIWKLSR